ncbi:MAG: hypothetical protein J6U05_06250 [Neisseriaceae bacterium]|nr:hypothetical protein [Neisseriaceae bacterium]
MKHALLFLCLSAMVGVLMAQPAHSTVPQDKVMVNRSFANSVPHHRPPPPRHHRPPPPRPVPYYGDYGYYGSQGYGGNVHIGRNTGHSSIGVNIGFDNRVYYPTYPNYSVYRNGYVVGYADGVNNARIIDRTEVIADGYGSGNAYECRITINGLHKYIGVAGFIDIAQNRAIENCTADWNAAKCHSATMKCDTVN